MITVIANLKGGTGKSTVTFNLAAWLGSNNHKVAVIDRDPQRTLTDVAALRMEDGIAPAIRVETGSLLDVAFAEDAEEILIDVGTADLESFKQAIMIADRILIPVTPSQADIWATQRFIRFLSKSTHGNPPESITFLNRVDTRKENQAPEQATAALNALPVVRLLPQRLSDSTVFQESFSEGLAVFELVPHSTASREFMTLAKVLFPGRQHSELDPLRKQKVFAVTDPGFRQMLESSSEQSNVGESAGDGEVKPVSPAETVQQIVRPEKEQKDKKNRKTREGKKQKKSAKAKSGKKEKKNKKRKKGKKSKKGKKGIVN